LVKEKDRAWHAGVSYWQGKTGLNDQSIGIELVYLSPCDQSEQPIAYHTGLNSNAVSDSICFYPDYDDKQISLLIDLVKDILERNPEISPTQIIGHSDITPDRRVDPGPRFPWHRLYKAGIGAWYEQEKVTEYWNQFLDSRPSIGVIQAALRAYGYGIIETGILDAPTINALTVFQMHFRPWEVNGKITAQTSATLFALLDRYFPKKLERLQQRIENEKTTANIKTESNFLGQFDGLFPSLDTSTRKLVKNRKIFKAYEGTGLLNITSDGANSA
ncbi:MAG: N-acetylmuramoyl-L-alanine amidase, partial [Gammaproteobacteria bacterium]|nr:N-acetylmuramoyl-L-alanine amidase [Gammaproteobacteria bacterium]